MTAVEALRRASYDLPDGPEDPGHRACESALLDGFSVEEVTAAEHTTDQPHE